METTDLVINKEFSELIPPLKENEFKQLETSILKEGIRVPLVVWNNCIIDGHNRYIIAQKYNLEFEVLNKEFNDIKSVKEWIINNQLGRRNLSDWQRYQLVQTKADLWKEEGKETQGQRTDLLSNIDKKLGYNTRNKVAEELNWATGKVGIADIVNNEADTKTKEMLSSGEITINKAYSNLKKTERKDKIEKQRQDIKEGKIELPQGKYEVIVIDPPWPYNSKYDPDTFRGATPYPEMTIEDLHKIDLPTTDNCILFLWTTHKFIWEAKELLNIWGFEYRSIIVWDKNKMGIGRLFRLQCEFCLVGLKGTPILSNNNTHRDIITESRREHSRKPEAFYIMVNELCVGRKLDYFSREKREGWGMLGKEEFNGTI